MCTLADNITKLQNIPGKMQADSKMMPMENSL